VRHRQERHLLVDAGTAEPADLLVKPAELGWRDFLVMLLQG
jgi:hypothetical protein